MNIFETKILKLHFNYYCRNQKNIIFAFIFTYSLN